MPNSTMAFALVELFAPIVASRGGRFRSGPCTRWRRWCARSRARFRGQLVADDLAHLELPVAFLERWWRALQAKLPAEAHGGAG